MYPGDQSTPKVLLPGGAADGYALLSAGSAAGTAAFLPIAVRAVHMKRQYIDLC